MGGYGLWQIEHRGEFRLALRRATSLPRGNKRDYVSYTTLVRWRFACALRGSARGFWFIDPLGLRPRGLCTVATRACHVNHAPPSYNYNMGFVKMIHSPSMHTGPELALAIEMPIHLPLVSPYSFRKSCHTLSALLFNTGTLGSCLAWFLL